MVDGEGSAVGRRTVAEWEGSVVFKSALRCDVETLLASLTAEFCFVRLPSSAAEPDASGGKSVA